MRNRSGKLIATLILAGSILLGLVPVRAAAPLPAQLSDKEFWKLISDLSEPEGFFHSENFVSNETGFQTVIPELAAAQKPGSAYIGVGPEQNFTYLLGVKPKIAFIVDIRRQNLVQHLMYKALFELSSDRADFLSRLLSRKRPANLGAKSTVKELFEAFGKAPRNPQLLETNLPEIRKRLIEDHGFPLSPDDESMLNVVFKVFSAGANLTYDGPVQARGTVTETGIMPTFEELMTSTDAAGVHQSFLATESNFRTIQDLQKKNLIVPVVGNFAGPHALKAVGRYLRDHDATVTAFYTSNVEHYLFRDGGWKEFYPNVATLPVNDKSVFIRGIIRSATGEISSSPALPLTSRYETALFPINDLVTAFKSGAVVVYADIVRGR